MRQSSFERASVHIRSSPFERSETPRFSAMFAGLMSPRLRTILPWLGVAVSALAIIKATTFPSGTSTHGWSFSLASGDAAIAEIIQNILLFIPLGICLTLARVRPVLAIALGAALSFSVEFSQQWIPGRDPSVGDILNNTISTALGVAITRTAPRWLLVSPERSAAQALGTAILAVLVWTGTGIALRPTVPVGPFQTTLRPDFNYFSRYQGDVVFAKIVQGSLTVKAVWPPPAEQSFRSAPLVVMMDAEGHRAVLLSEDRTDLALRYDMLAVRLRLEQPDLRWRGAFAPLAPGDTFTTGTWHDDGHVCLGLNTQSRCNLGYTLGDGWKLIFFPEHFAPWLNALIDGLWVMGCVFFMGIWAGRSPPARGIFARIAVGIVLVGLVVVPWVTGLKGTTLVEWVCALLGIEFGLVVGTRSLRSWNDLVDPAA